MALTNQQLRLADSLKAIRPEVIPGTNVIPDHDKRLHYYYVCKMVAPDVDSMADLSAFYDRCGIPD